MIQAMKPTRVVSVDGIDGSGKSTILEFIKEELEGRGFTVFDLSAFQKKSGEIPLYKEIPDADFIFSSEPTHAWIGSAIRSEIIRADANYGVLYQVEALALDRAVQLKRVILPALADGKRVIQDRSYLSSLAYQSARGGITFCQILDYPGNALAATHPPDILIFVDCPVEVALARLPQRDKKDNSLFEEKNMLERVRARFHSPEFIQHLHEKKIERMIINTNKKLGEIKEEIKKLSVHLFPQP